VEFLLLVGSVVCDLNKLETASAIQSVTLIDDCTAKMIIQSAYACPVKTFCESLPTLDSCVNTEKLCVWATGKCEPATGCIGWKRFTDNAGGVVMIVVLSVIAAALACTCGLCVCCCIRKKNRRMRNRKCMLMKRCNKKSARRAPGKNRNVKKQDQEVEYAPFQMPVQLIPGGFAPVNPYSNIQGYPMVTLVAPTGEEDEQV